MSTSGKLRSALAGAVLLAGALAALPAQAEPAASTYTGWVHREDGPASGSGTTYTLAGADAVLYTSAWDGQISVYNTAASNGIGAYFAPPAGQTLQAGQTYRADVSKYPAGVSPGEPSSSTGLLMLYRDNKMCGKTEDELFAEYRGDSIDPKFAPATGWFHISELEYDVNGNLTRFAATYEMNCQFVGGPPGFEGSVAVNSSLPPVPVPDAPVTPGPVSDLEVTNVGPNGSGDNSTTLTWTNPAGSGDVNVDAEHTTDRSKLPSLLGMFSNQRYRGSAGRYSQDQIGFQDTETYRLVARGTSGRLGPPTFVTVLGTRLSLPNPKQTITIGQTETVSGRLSLAWDYVDPADIMKGPGLVGRTVVLCEQSYINYVDGECTRVDRTTTTTDGHFTLSTAPKANSLYTVVVPATSTMVGNTFPSLITKVAPRTDLRTRQSARVSARMMPQVSARMIVRRGSLITFTTVRARRGSRGFVRLQRLDGTKWHTIMTKRLGRGSATSRLTLPYREYKRGRHVYRVVKPGDAHHVNGYSRIVHIQVR